MEILTRAQPPLEFIAPAFNPMVLKVSKTLLPFWMKSKTDISDIEAFQVEELASLFQQFQQGKVRFLLAFRHPSVDDPLCLAKLVWNLVPAVAKKHHISLSLPIHAHFIYDRGIPLWAGEKVGWLYSKLGGTPIMRGKTDLTGLRFARQLFVDGKFPMAAAPEGATNGHNEIVSPLEPGIAQLSFWCVEDLIKANRNEEVFIVPVGIQYRYLTPPWQALGKLMTQLELESGLLSEIPSETISLQPTQEEISGLRERLYRLGEFILSGMEDFYVKYYHQTLPRVVPENEGEESLLFRTRLQNLLEVALRVAESYFDLTPKGNFTDRCRRLEQAGWDCIYRMDFKTTQNLSVLQRGLANLVAEEASLRMWHMRLVETFVAVTGYYVKEKPSPERFAETTLLLSDFLSRLKGENPFNRPKLGKLIATVRVGTPISVTSMWSDYQQSRRSAVASLTLSMEKAFESLIVSVPQS